MAGVKDQSNFVLFCDLATKLDAVAYFELRIAAIIESERSQSILEAEVGIEKERILVNDFAFVAALRAVGRDRKRSAVAGQIGVTEFRCDDVAFDSGVTDRHTQLLPLALV